MCIILCVAQVGTGYSFTVVTGYSKNEEDVAENLYSCLEQFFMLFPYYQKNDFYLTGEVHMQGRNSFLKVVGNLSHCLVAHHWKLL